MGMDSSLYNIQNEEAVMHIRLFGKTTDIQNVSIVERCYAPADGTCKFCY